MVAHRSSPRERLRFVLAATTQSEGFARLYDIRDALLDGDDSVPWFAAAVELEREGVLRGRELFYILSMLAYGHAAQSYATDALLIDVEAQMKRIEREHGLGEDDYWSPAEAPADWRQFKRRSDARLDELLIAALIEAGASEVVEVIRRSTEEYLAAVMAGAEDFESRWPSSST